MARALRVELAGGVYHVVARGNERKAIFRDDVDRRIYLGRLAECRDRLQFRILAYCLMGNHVHLALQRGPIALSRIMLALQSVYARKFNVRHGRVGHLFQGRYKAFLVQGDRYLFALVRYIHLNPVVASLVGKAESYPWSSDRHYRRGSGPVWLDMDVVLGQLGSKRPQAVSAYCRLMTARKAQSYEELEAYSRTVKGDPDFATRALGTGVASLRSTKARAPEDVADFVAREEGLSLERLRQVGKTPRESRARLIAAYLGKREAGLSIARMATCLGREESTFCRGVKRLEERIEADASLRHLVEGMARRLRNTGIHD